MILEAFLARLYKDEALRRAFLDAPRRTAIEAGLAPADVEALERIDRDGLVLAAESFRRKRERAR